jgi:hypothetical protein
MFILINYPLLFMSFEGEVPGLVKEDRTARLVRQGLRVFGSYWLKED